MKIKKELYFYYQADWNSKTPLHCAAANGFGDIAKLLVENKADLKAEDENGKTAEQIAEDIKEEEMAAFLKACASGKIPAKAPAAKVFDTTLKNTKHVIPIILEVREQREFREVIPLEGCGEGCAVPE